VQANVVVLPKADAFDFLLFCIRNPKPCPIVEVLEPGSVTPFRSAPEADMRTDVPLYRVYREGELIAEVPDIRDYWREDFVTFLIGCSYTTDGVLGAAGIRLRNLENDNSGPMFKTSVACEPAGRFSGPLVVSMRPMTPRDAIQATSITARLPRFHGAPVHIGDPAAIGISNIDEPDYGEPLPLLDGELPVFWGCGVTPQAVALESRTELMITHAPGHMFVTSIREAAEEV
jgi:uncharacterized protein YcsI (UPF0317 family)